MYGGSSEHVTSRLRELRERAGVSMQTLAKLMGKRGASSYQRYENPALFKKDYLPIGIADALADALAGKGNPPVTRAEVFALAGFTGQLLQPDELALLEKYRQIPEAARDSAVTAVDAVLGAARAGLSFTETTSSDSPSSPAIEPNARDRIESTAGAKPRKKAANEGRGRSR
jgi:transcriptional regulator with XRE-family HTH domain